MNEKVATSQQSLTDFMAKKIAKAKDLGRQCDNCGVLFLDEDFDVAKHICWFNPPFKRDAGCGISWKEDK
jgi:hypothetical protein